MPNKSKKASDPGNLNKKYNKLSHHEHILKKPDTYIGYAKPERREMWISNKLGSNPPFIHKSISYVPGLYKIYDEILVNARDHVVRCEEKGWEKCTIIRVDIDRESGRITVWNNGAGLDVAEHPKHKSWIPTMIFGELLTSTNYDETEKRKVGGTNGLGAKLANIYSTEFELETVDHERKLKFYQKFENNMYDVSKPKITKCSTKPYTKISFIPDYERFGLKNGLTKDIMALFTKRVYDIAMNSTAKIYFNGSKEFIKSNNLTKYVDLYFPDTTEITKVSDLADENWKIAAVYDPKGTVDHQNISFVNGICTHDAGSHVDYVTKQIVDKIKTQVSKKHKGLVIKPAMIKENLIFFVDSVVINPNFESQTKEKLKTSPSNFGSSYKVPDVFVNKIIKTGIIDNVIMQAELKAQMQFDKGTGAKKSRLQIPKLEDAIKAGGKDAAKCSLILVEGDSAKAFAISGTNVIGKDYFGIFPLRGKMLNVREKSMDKVFQNEEIKNVCKIMGLELGKKYKTTDDLRYGSLIILTDQDADGSHIKGLIMNFLQYFWPDLVKIDGFIRCLATPIVKAKRGRGKKEVVEEFISLQDYEKWRKVNDKGWTIKYYKGLGTSNSKEAQDCFRNIEDKLITYEYTKDMDKKEYKRLTKANYEPNSKDMTQDAITLAFDKTRADDRKAWLKTYNDTIYIDNSEKHISYPEFFHKEFISYSIYDVQRNIPNIMDGFKPSQRKIFCASVKKNIYANEIKVAQLSGYVSETMSYHHGEDSLAKAIISMARTFVGGGNNINVLEPLGQFGTRVQGGADASAPRYIHTKLNALDKFIFKEEDFPILTLEEDDGMKIEPSYYVPILPMILVNGANGIGTGYSTLIHPCNPLDISANIRRMLSGSKPKAMKPWYRHFTGTVEKLDTNKFICRARYEIDGDTLIIRDFPIGVWNENFKADFYEILNETSDPKNKPAPKRPAPKRAPARKRAGSKASAKKTPKKPPVSKRMKTLGSLIKSYRNNCTDTVIDFRIQFKPGELAKLVKSGTLESKLKLSTVLNGTNMHLFNSDKVIRKYSTYGAILKEFVDVRLKYYEIRKKYLLKQYAREINLLYWKVKFIRSVISGKIAIFQNKQARKKADVIKDLEAKEFPRLMVGSETEASYNYLTSMSWVILTKEEIEKLEAQLALKEKQRAELKKRTEQELWLSELDEFDDAYQKWSEADTRAYKANQSGK